MNGVKALALAVILQALEDLQFPGRAQLNDKGAAHHSLMSAKEFCLIQGNPDLAFWCSAAGLSSDVVVGVGNQINSGKIDITAVKKAMRKAWATKPTAQEEEDDE